MMAADGLFKEFGEAFGRLFDHRPVLQGEVNFCQREFEEKRGNREETRLQKCLEYGKEINEKLIPQIIEILQTDFPNFSMSVTEAVGLSQQIMDNENKSPKNEWLEQRRIQRSRDWSEFLDTMTSKVSDIDVEFANEVALVKVHYKELEEKLKITDSKERTEVEPQQNKMEMEQDGGGVNQKDRDEVVKDIVTSEQEAKMGDDRVRDGVEITRKGQGEVYGGEGIAEETAQGIRNDKAEENKSIKTVEEEMVNVAEDGRSDILSSDEALMKDRKETNMDKTETD